jgi:hypothetical protein
VKEYRRKLTRRKRDGGIESSRRREGNRVKKIPEAGLRARLKAMFPARLQPRLRPFGRAWDNCLVERTILADRVRTAGRRGRSGLPGPLIVTLTSYPPRFAHLHRTLKCLLRQTVVPDRLVLWIDEASSGRLPRKVRNLERRGVEIRFGRDLGSYNKLVPALRDFPDAFLVTADDDIYYQPRWLEALVGGFDSARPSIICHRAHRTRIDSAGEMAPYEKWEKDVQDASARARSTDIVPTGAGGVLYPPGSLAPGALDEALIRQTCPTTDDFWFYWMAREAGSTHRKVGDVFACVSWPDSQDCAMHWANMQGGYDRQIGALVKLFGLPSGLA